jgi:CBS domain-containing protein
VLGVDFRLQLATERGDRAHPASALCVEVDTTARAVLGLMKERNRGAVMVCQDGVLVGIFTERDALRMMAQGAGVDVPIRQVMTPHPVALSPTDTVASAIVKMSQGGYRRLPIVDEAGRPRGIVKVSGVLHYLVEHFPRTVYNLPPVSFHATHDREGA